MRITRVYADQPLAAESSVELGAGVAHYLGTVLRLTAGDTVHPFNGNDGEFRATIEDIRKKRIRLQLHEPLPRRGDPPLRIHLGLGLSRGERMDYAVQKATELGATSLTPLFTSNSEVKLNPKRAAKRRDHWQKVAISACEQSGRCLPLRIADPMTLTEWLRVRKDGPAFVLDQRATSSFPTAAPNSEDLTLLSGPEGGLDEAEFETALAHDFRQVRMGPRILRTETAPLVALSLVQYLYGDLSE